MAEKKPNRARARAIRSRMAETGETYALAARRHDAERMTTGKGSRADDQPGQIREWPPRWTQDVAEITEKIRRDMAALTANPLAELQRSMATQIPNPANEINEKIRSHLTALTANPLAEITEKIRRDMAAVTANPLAELQRSMATQIPNPLGGAGRTNRA
jgi:DNA anti-recombination protein RmuC